MLLNPYILLSLAIVAEVIATTALRATRVPNLRGYYLMRCF